MAQIILSLGANSDKPAKFGKPIMLQNEWHSIGAMKCPVRTNRKAEYAPKIVVYMNWNTETEPMHGINGKNVILLERRMVNIVYLLELNNAAFRLTPIRNCSIIRWMWAAPKNNGHMKTALIGSVQCSMGARMQDLKTNSSVIGATTWFRRKISPSPKFPQYFGSKIVCL